MTNKKVAKYKEQWTKFYPTLDPTKYLDSYLFIVAAAAEKELKRAFKEERKRINLCKDHEKKSKSGTYGGCCVCEVRNLSIAIAEIDRLFSPDADEFVATDYELTFNAEAVVEKARNFVAKTKEPIYAGIPENCGESKGYLGVLLPRCSGGTGCIACWSIFIKNQAERSTRLKPLRKK